MNVVCGTLGTIRFHLLVPLGHFTRRHPFSPYFISLSLSSSTFRSQEHQSIFASQSMKACTLALYFAAPALASVVMYSVYTRAMGKELKVQTVYSAVALLNLLRVMVSHGGGESWWRSDEDDDDDDEGWLVGWMVNEDCHHP